MKFKTEILDSINVNRFAKYIVFNTCDIAPELITKARKGLSFMEKIVTGMIEQELLTHALRLEDAAEIVGISKSDAKRCIRHTLKLGQDFYDGTYGRPETITPEHAVYVTLALVLREYGRKSEDLVEYIVLYELDEYLDISIIQNEYDMACVVFLAEYFEYCLRYGKTSISKFLADNSNNFVSSKRLMNYIKKNDWYGTACALEKGFESSTPKLSEVTSVLLDRLQEDLEAEKQRHDEYELNKAFDEKK